MRFIFFFTSFLIVSICSFGQINQAYQNTVDCLDLQIEVLAEPFCAGSFNGGQLKVNVSAGSGSGDYSYEWLDDNGNDPPGGPQTNATTLSFLTVNQTYWAYVTDNVTSCYDSVSYIFEDYSCQQDTASLEVQSPFDMNPVGYSQYSECDIKLVNLGCQLNFKPEFTISHETEDIELNDFIIEFYNAQSNWESIPYSINTDGDAVGYWGSQSGETLNCDITQVRPVRVKFNQFNPTAPTGEYMATLRLWSVDENGDPLSVVSEEAYVSLTLMDTICEDLSVNSQLTNASCSGVNDAQIILSGSGGEGPYLFSLSNSPYSTDSIFNLLTNGIYFAAIKDANNCQNSDTLHIGPAPVLPDSIWFNSIYPFAANIVWNVDSLVDGYKFRYREVGQSWQGPVASGNYTNGIAEMLPYKTLSGLTPATTYEVQVKANSLTGCEEGWSTEIYTFMTPMEVYVYNIDNTCVGTNSGQIEFEVITNNAYTFDWQGPNGFSSTDTSIYNLAEGDYNLQISNGQGIIFDSTFVVAVSDSDIGVTLNGDPSLISYSVVDQVYYAQSCDLISYVIADSGYSNYSWHYGDSLHYVEGQQILIDTSNVFVQVEALDSNNCILTSDSIHISIVSDYVNLIDANGNEDYIDDVYVLCSADSSINIDISSFMTGNYSIEWREIVGSNSILLSENDTIEIIPTQSTNYVLNVSSCSFDFYVNFYPSPNIDVQHTNLLCYGDTNATIYIETDSSNSINYSLIDLMNNVIYFNNTNLPMDTIENIAAGTYTVELKDEFLCVVSQQVDILQPDSLYFDSLQVQNIECFAQSLGSMSFKVYGGVDPDIFILNGIPTELTQNAQGYFYIEDLMPMSYTIEVIDLNGCYHSLEFEIIEAPPMFFSVNSYSDTISCYGESTAIINLNVSGGTPSYIFDLYNPDSLYAQQSSNIFNELPANTYEAFITDSFGCKDSLTLTINQYPQLIISEQVSLHQDVLCNGDSTGFISMIIEGGDFDSNNSSFTQSYNNLKAGLYAYEIIDSSGCSATSDSIQIVEPLPIIISLTSLQYIDCLNSSGNVGIEISGGVLPYIYSLNGIDTFDITLPNQTITFNNLETGDYTLNLFDANSCIDSLSFSIEDQSTFDLTVANISDTLSCYGDSTGFIQVEIGFPGNYTYSLIQGETVLISNQQSSYFENLPAGEYVVAAVDDQDCVDSLYFSIIENPQLLLSEDLDLHQDVLCDGSALGSVTTIIQGGKMPYNVGLAGDSMYSYPHQFNNLYVGEYSFVVVDSEGCLSDTLTSEIVTNPILPELVIISANQVDCQGLGSATFELISGNEPFIFRLNGAITTVNLDAQNQFTILNLEANPYELTIKDNFLCADTLDFEIFNNSEIEFEIIDINDTLPCYMDSSGFVEFGVQNGTGPYIFDLVLDGDTILTQNNNVINGLPIGDYIVHLTDAADCHQQLSFSIVAEEIIISDSLELHKDVSCYGANDGEFMLHIESIYPSHVLRLTDTLNTVYPWYNHPHLFDNLAGGIYTVEVATAEDDNCPYFFEVEILEPDSFILDSILVTDVICSGDSTGILEAYYSGGTPNFTYVFNNDSSILANELYAASYYLEIIDSNGCIIDTNFTVNEPNELILSLVDSITFNVSCFGNNDGQIGLDASGGVPPYQYSILGSAVQDTNVIVELLADTFIVSVTDSVGCEDTLTVIISHPELNLFIDSYQLSDSLGFCALCYGDSTGFIDILITGGTPAYDYFIVNEPDTFTSPHIEKLVGGEEYQFFAIDAQGCLTDTITVECTSPDEIILEIETATLPSCCYTCDSEVVLSAVGGITPYTYGFENGIFQSDSLFDQLCGDSSYTFKILDSFGCEKQDSSLIVENRPCLTVDTLNYINNELPALIHYDICQADGTAKIYTSALEGVGSYSFSINGEPFIQQEEIMFDSLYQGNHYIIVKDEYNCLDTLNFEVDAPNPIVISDLFIDTIYCGAPTLNSSNNQSDIGSILAIASGASSGVYFYSLDEIDSVLYQSNGFFDDLDSGYYSMNIIDLNDCVEEFDIHIPFYSASVEYSVSDITCPDFSNGIIEIDTVIGGFNPWVTFDGNTTTNNSFSSISEGQHNLTIHYFIPNSTEICSYTDTIEFFDKEPLDFSYELKNPTCNGVCDGSISIAQIDGGTSPYTILCLNTTDTTLVFEGLCADEYAIKMVDSNGCFIIQDVMMLEPNALYPIIDFEDGQLVVIEPTIGSPLSGVPPYTYQWYDSNGQIAGANDSLYDPALPGDYSVVVTDDTDCIGESSFYNIEVLAMSNWDSDLVNVYPNPFKDRLKVSTESKDRIDWIISDTRGRVVQSGQDIFSWTINTSKLYNGIYFLRLKKGNNELIYKIVKQ
ncbi:MAG: T9SS type A sorting domain-containing protein [Flavobacteriales bacterium]|nr:T9SS type A sorting domain-containing protein [Flavobacteriales bacterium]